MSGEHVELIRRMAARDTSACAAFYDAYAGVALGIIRRIVSESHEAEDVLQEVFVELWHHAEGYDPARGSPAAWVVMRARSRAIDRGRAVRRRAETVLEERHREQSDPGADDLASQVADRTLVAGALDHLPPAQREVIQLAYFGGLSQSEIAAQLRQPLGTVKTRIRSALLALRGLLGATA